MLGTVCSVQLGSCHEQVVETQRVSCTSAVPSRVVKD